MSTELGAVNSCRGKRNKGVAEWYIQQLNAPEDLGPLRPGDLLKKVRCGEVKPDTLIRKGDSAWFHAAEVGGLFEAAMRPTIEYFCPQCDRPVSEPPVMCSNCGREVRKAKTRITENSISNGSPRPDQPGRSVQSWLKRKMLRRPKDGEA
ncbi:DUF4339 domain-containing protein [Novipirellula sp. SH528]|uniref:DUF4339 domain-containing protein n=1 Tax=Novipirellula sp. SH528 TaxID=3454466 RepID=UPI003FA00EC2